MTVRDFMEKMGRYENFYICVAGKYITNDEEVSLYDVQVGNEERPQVLDALDKELISVDAEEWILYCEDHSEEEKNERT